MKPIYSLQILLLRLGADENLKDGVNMTLVDYIGKEVMREAYRHKDE